jgi:hypothetical protein
LPLLLADFADAGLAASNKFKLATPEHSIKIAGDKFLAI